MLYFSLADEREDVQKKTFTKWINAQFAKVINLFLLFRNQNIFSVFFKKEKNIFFHGSLFFSITISCRYYWAPLTDLLETMFKFYYLDFSWNWNVRSHHLLKQLSAQIYFAFSQTGYTDILLFLGLLCFILNIQRRLFYWACLFLFLVAITNLTKLYELGRSKVKDKRCD